MPSNNKLVRYQSIEVNAAFEKESELLQQVQNNELAQVLLLWQAKTPTLVLPAGNKWQNTPENEAQLLQTGWQLCARKTGGAPVPQQPGIINLSHIYHWPQGEAYNIQQAYLSLCHVLTAFFAELDVKVDIHATPDSYCDGDYNLNINGQKVVGTAQRVLLKKGGGQVVLSQACILLDVDLVKAVQPVNLFNQLCDNPTVVKAEVHTPLFAHLKTPLAVDTLYQKLTEAFLQYTDHSSQ
ncbi:lipoate--protein ligase [Photobacterium jeanii]|uniref:Lipoate--protein ligase n=1 Tax=Photobacterium jeanii TaxID=858640 RepID=A0A178K7J3_9GAMM|nr:lipoate--protein ligase [Photobacterium jeanii]OAN13261.1 lipoate--protein ligase [Photobacterium jeanii]PST90258.1 lipoate--protein ligase [Photobacterium jeanii]